MRQEVRVTVTLTYDADAKLSRQLLLREIVADLNRLADADSEARVQMTDGQVLKLEEEAEIYGTETA